MLESLFNSEPGGYAHVINVRRIGFPVVHIESDFRSSLRYGDTFRCECSTERIGNKSITIRYEFSNEETSVATILQTVAVTDLKTMRAIPINDELRAFFERHRKG